MVKLTQYLSPSRIRQGVLCSSKKRVLELLGEIVSEQSNIAEQLCFEQLLNREKMGCTAIGNGIALPHAKLPEGSEPIAVFLQLATPIDYHAADHREVDLVYALFIPEQCCSQCSNLLADLAQRLSHKALSKQLRAAQSADEIWEILAYVDSIDSQTEVDEAADS